MYPDYNFKVFVFSVILDFILSVGAGDYFGTILLK